MKTALITGGTAGIGRVTALALARKGYRLILIARDAKKGNSLAEHIRHHVAGADVRFYAVDLSDFTAVREMAADIRTHTQAIQLLILNAGLYTRRHRLSESGHEFMFATTHLGHFLLTHELMPLVRKASSPRIIVTSSVAHHLASLIRFFPGVENPTRSKLRVFAPLLSYSRSKLANLLFVRSLADRLQSEDIQVHAFHPGGVRTELWRSTPGLLNRLINPFLIDAEEGADTQIYLATDPTVKHTGQYWCRRRRDVTSMRSRNQKLREELWNYSEKTLGISDFGQPEQTVAA